MLQLYKKTLFFVVIFIGSLSLHAQDQTPSQKYDNLEKESIGRYTLSANEIGLSMNYGQFNVLNNEVIQQLKESEISEIRLIYTDHPKSLSFKILNTNRLRQLKSILPELFSSSSIKWFLVKQTNCPNKKVAQSYFHGFAFKVIEKPKEVIVTKKQEEPVKEIVENTAPQTIINENDEPENSIPKHIRQVLKEVPKKDWRYFSVGSDSISIKIFQRNHDKWGDNIVTVSDWTASMYPYTTQVLRWHLNNQKDSKIRNFVFFNDGDKKRNNEKKKGKIGGIYSIQAESVPKIVNMMKLVKSRGDGGDLEENDIEALIWAMDKYPEADEFTLIADNKSEVRDMSLMGKLDNKPVRIILGRLPEEDFSALNLQYIDLALKTKGSIHTFEKDFYTKKELNDLKKYVKGLRKQLKEEMEKRKQQQN